MVPVAAAVVTERSTVVLVLAEAMVAMTVSAPSKTVSPTGSTVKVAEVWPAGMVMV
jgi:hypothetical protein